MFCWLKILLSKAMSVPGCRTMTVVAELSAPVLGARDITLVKGDIICMLHYGPLTVGNCY